MSITAMKQALEALENKRHEYRAYQAITALRQAIEQAEKQPMTICNVCNGTGMNGDNKCYACHSPVKKESTPRNVDPRVPLDCNDNFTKNIENRLCDLERRMSKIETHPIEQAETQQALDKKADNARELGLDYEPEEFVRWSKEKEFIAKVTDVSDVPFAMACLNEKGKIVEYGPYQITFAHEIDHIPLYTKDQLQRKWVGLTDEEVNKLCYRFMGQFDKVQFVYAVEAKLKEKNGG